MPTVNSQQLLQFEDFPKEPDIVAGNMHVSVMMSCTVEPPIMDTPNTGYSRNNL